MDTILIVDEGGMDRQVAVDILSTGMRGVELLTAASACKALDMICEKQVDLLIVDTPYPLLPMEELVQEARRLSPNMSVLVVSALRDAQVSPVVQRVGADGYLLKPYRPAQLLAEGMRLLQSTAFAAVRNEQDTLDEYTALLGGAIREYDYKKCVNLSKEYLDFLYDTLDNMVAIRTRTVEFAEKLIQLDEEISKESSWRLSGCLARFRLRHDLQGTKYYSLCIFEEMLDIIFEGLDQEVLYSENTLQRVLNFIDRNTKKGVTLDEAAEYVSMSSCYFSKFFKKEAGVNFIDYITGRKIDYAKEMLRDTDMPVINIAYELSYNETGYFSKAFKKKVGITPTEYREQVHGPARAPIALGRALAAGG